MQDNIPFSQACENNKGPILNVLKSAFANASNVLEIGTGTGQHAVFFAKHLPHLIWQTADQKDYHAGIHYWLREYPSPNLKAPVELHLPHDSFPTEEYDAYFTANTAHIMQKSEVEHLMSTIDERLPAGGCFCQYGPFLQDGEFSSQSNAEFHEKLINTGRGGYRDVSELQAWAPNLRLDKIITMPANNFMLLWKKSL